MAAVTSLLMPQTHQIAPLSDAWPVALHPETLNALDAPTPFLALDLATVDARYQSLSDAIPGLQIHYAVKCNPAPAIVTRLAERGAGFEVASFGELELLCGLGVNAEEVLFSNPVKPASHITAAREAGLWRFAFDSEAELHKLAQAAPGAAVYARVRVDDGSSRFPLSRKFGAEAGVARSLMLLARELGLRPHGLTFHVGSQCTSPVAWRSSLSVVSRLMQRLQDDGIVLDMIDLGGGLPARYIDPVPSVDEVGRAIVVAAHDLLPYQPQHLVMEPGRYLVGECGVLASTVIGREERAGEEWLYIDVGVYNGLMETQQLQNNWAYPLSSSRWAQPGARSAHFTVAGPSCDSADTMFVGVELPASLTVDDRIYIGTAGAYTTSYASNFNGFPAPQPIVVTGA
jgi:ornithine decarboxylase